MIIVSSIQYKKTECCELTCGQMNLLCPQCLYFVFMIAWCT